MCHEMSHLESIKPDLWVRINKFVGNLFICNPFKRAQITTCVVTRRPRVQRTWLQLFQTHFLHQFDDEFTDVNG